MARITKKSNINELIKKLSSLKKELNESDKRPPRRRFLIYREKVKQKDELILQIRKELTKVNESKRKEIKRLLFRKLAIWLP